MAIGTKDLRPSELDGLEDTRLTDELKKAKEELFNLRFQSATGTLEGHGRLRAVKRDIARIYTVLRERELGIRVTPAPAVVAAPAPKKTRSRKAAASGADAGQTETEQTDTEQPADAGAETSTTAAATAASTEESN